MTASNYPAKRAYMGEEAASTYDEKRFFGRIGSLMNNLELQAIERLLRAIAPGVYALDVASGTGRVSRLLSEQFEHAVALDISASMLSQENPGAPVIADAEKLPFPDDAFDAVTCLRLFGHLPPEIRVTILGEMARVTKRYLIVAYYHRRASARAKDLVNKLRGQAAPRYLVSDRQFLSELQSCSLRVVTTYGTGFQVSGKIHLLERV
jgi:ubiquinone/menaquinone biosynthesis C-methylase UbiE